MADHKSCLLDIFDDLDGAEFERFQWQLRNEGKVKKAKLDNANREQTIDAMVGIYDDNEVLEVTKRILKKIDKKDLVLKLPNTGSDSGSKGPGPAKRKSSYELAKEPAAKKPELKKPVGCKNRKKATEHDIKQPTSTNKAPAKEKAQPKEAKPRVVLKKVSKKATKEPTSTGTNKSQPKKKAQPKEAKPRKAISKKKMDLKTVTEGPIGPHKKLQPSKAKQLSESTLLKIKNIKSEKLPGGYVSLQGQITSMDFRMIHPKKKDEDPYPLRKLKLREDGVEMDGSIALWREAAKKPLAEGMDVKISHLRAELTTPYGLTFNSTTTTNVEVEAPRGPKKKDPNLPKKPLSAYMLFSSERHRSVKQQNPALSFEDCSKKVGEMWRSLTESEKQPYEKKYNMDMVAYRCSQNPGSSAQGGDEEGTNTLTLPADERLSSVRSNFIDSVSLPNLNYLVEKLFTEDVLTDAEREMAAGMQAKKEKARCVIDTVRHKGPDASSSMISILCEMDTVLSKHLGLM